MSCNQDLFINQENNIKNLYAKDIIDGKYENIDFWIYTASKDNKFHVNKQQHKLYIPCDDSLEGTYIKTLKTFSLINKLNLEYDYIIKTNCSTYINVPLLNRFINETDLNEKNIYCGSIYCSDNATGPFNWCFYGVGNSLILSKYWINNIVTTDITKFPNYVVSENKPYYKIDDNALGLQINSIAFQNKLDMYNIWQSFKFPILNTIPDDPYNYIIIPFREYNAQQTRNNELNNSINIHNKITDYYKHNDINNIDITDILKNQIIYIMDFNRGMRSIVSRSFCDKFLNIMSLPKYLKVNNFNINNFNVNNFNLNK